MGKLIDLVGQQFGTLRVVKRLPNSKGHTMWECICENCGREKACYGNNLRAGKQINCGYQSCGGTKLGNLILQDKNVKFIAQWKNKNYILHSGYPCVFDFAFFTKENDEIPVFLLEYNGQQHYITRNSGWDTEENLFHTQQRDAEKAKLCEEAGIPLEIIPYTDFSKLEEVLTSLLHKYNLL